MSDVPFILSLAYKNDISFLCADLKKLGLGNFSLYIVFNNGDTFVLANTFEISKAYWLEKWYLEDFTYSTNMLNPPNGYYLCNEKQVLSTGLKDILEEKYDLYRVYNIVRSHPECTFVFSAISNQKKDDDLQFYKKSINDFEEFCIKFLDHFIDLIKNLNPAYKYSFILNNPNLRRAVIKNQFDEPVKLTAREQECLFYVSTGLSVKKIAENMNISYFTAENYCKNIREAFNCGTMIEAILEAVHRGFVGKINEIPNGSKIHKFPSNNFNFAYVMKDY